MNIFLWIGFGILTGCISSRISSSDKSGTIQDILLGSFGGFVGGVFMSLFGELPIVGFNFYSLFVAVLGSVMFVTFARALRV